MHNAEIENNKSTENTQYTGFYVETLNRGKPREQIFHYVKEKYRRKNMLQLSDNK